MSLKGDTFVNRYRLEGELVTVSPLHIGNGEIRKDPLQTKDANAPKEVEVSLVATDIHNKPFIPGSALRGILRHYLRNLFVGMNKKKIADDTDFEAEKFKNFTQQQQIQYMRNEASMLDRIFGTPFAEGKVEFWDAPAVNAINTPVFADRGWNAERNTYVVKSVAIDPVTGTASAHKLYTFEVVPVGMKFHLNLVGQNLDDEEMGLLLLGLEAFNSDIYRLTIGAMSGRGFGQVTFSLEKLYCLSQKELPAWAKNALLKTESGYYSLPEIAKEKNEFIHRFKTALLKML
jgi:CRISPR-associated protein Csm3